MDNIKFIKKIIESCKTRDQICSLMENNWLEKVVNKFVKSGEERNRIFTLYNNKLNKYA